MKSSCTCMLGAILAMAWILGSCATMRQTSSRQADQQPEKTCHNAGCIFLAWALVWSRLPFVLLYSGGTYVS